MRRTAPLTTMVLLVLVTMAPAPAQAERRLTMKQAATETNRQATIEASSWPGFPQFVSSGGGSNCTRRSRLRIVCGFWVADRLADGGSSEPQTCDFRADVRLPRTGTPKVSSTVTRLGCQRR